MKALKPGWYKEFSKGSEDLDLIQPATARKPLAPIPAVADMVPPFRGLSRQLLTMKEACAHPSLKVSMTTLRKLLRERMIFAQPRGRLIYIPIEEIENYNARAQLRDRERRHA